MIPLRDVPENRHECETPRDGSVIVVFCLRSVRWPVRSIWAVAVDGCSEAVETLIVNYERSREEEAMQATHAKFGLSPFAPSLRFSPAVRLFGIVIK